MKVVSWSITAVLGIVVVGLAFIGFSPDYNMYIVRSESMRPAINLGDAIVTGPPGDLSTARLEPGVIVTYKRGKELITHRVASVDGDSFLTKGDALEEHDPWRVNMSQVTGIYLFKLPYVGYLSSFMRTKLGWFLVIVLPGVVLVAIIIKDILKEAFKPSPQRSGGKVGKG